MIDNRFGFIDEIAHLVEHVQSSLVVLHNGQHGVGAGIIWRQDGLILTNFHVVAHGRQIKASLQDHNELPARLIAKAAEIDLALLQVEAQGVPAAQIADSRRLRVGQLVLAIGHPWGQRGVVTAGLISSLNKAHTSNPDKTIDVIRSDARLAPGNSGGPLVDAAGRVIGINTMVIGGDQGLAISSHEASNFVNQALLDFPEDLNHPWERSPQQRLEQPV